MLSAAGFSDVRVTRLPHDIVNAYFVSALLRLGESLLARIPVVKTMFGAFKDFTRFLPAGGGESRDEGLGVGFGHLGTQLVEKMRGVAPDPVGPLDDEVEALGAHLLSIGVRGELAASSRPWFTPSARAI